MTSALQLHEFRIFRNTQPILALPDLALEKGEILAVIGPNGVGKSTLLQTINGLLDHYEGTIQVFGETRGRHNRAALRRRMAMVFQEPLLLDDTVLNNVTLGLKLRGISRTERETQGRHWLARFQVEGLASRHARELSGGEAQRVSLARALALKPDLLLLDEPFSALDPASRKGLIRELGEILREGSTSTIFVTHNLEEMVTLADQGALLLDGQLIQRGKPESILTRPRTEKAARFLGLENLVEAESAGGRLILSQGGEQVALPWNQDEFPRRRAYISPNRVELVRPPSEISPVGQLGPLPLGLGQTGVRIELGKRGAWSLTAAYSRRELEKEGWHEGDRVSLAIPPDGLHFFEEL